MPGASRTVVINAPMEKVFSVITDYPGYIHFLPELKSIKVLERQGPEAKVQYEVNVIKNIRYVLRMREEKPDKLSWTFVEGEVMKDNKGSWKLVAEGEGKTRATYSIEMAVGLFVPKSILNMLVDSGLPKMLDAFRRRAEGM
jgi:coenzyme Q-binding protein COQ10